MKETKTKLKDLGFTQGHAHLLIVAVAFFAVLTFVQSDLSLRALFANADDEVTMLTYDDVLNEVTTEYGGISSEADAKAEEQLALLERSLDSGQVLGEAVGLDSIPTADSIFSPDSINNIPVKMLASSTQEDFQNYADDMTYIESSNDIVTLLANINSNDPAVIQQSKDQVVRIIQMMGTVYVPQEYVEYHRYKTVYFTSLTNLADIWMKNRPASDLQTQSTLLFSVMSKVETLKSELESKYQIKL